MPEASLPAIDHFPAFLARLPSHVDLESLALFELGVLVEDEYKVKFGEDDLSSMALMTLDEFTAAIEVRLVDASAVTAATTTADVQ